MRVLIVKTSSLGDLIHTFPALTEAATARPEVEFHWLAEEALVEVPAWHPAVTGVLPIALRRWRRGWWRAWRAGEPQALRRRLRQGRFDLILDAQGLIKSALPARLAGAPVVGYDRHSAREPVAAAFYGRRIAVARHLHAIERLRRLFALALDYPQPQGPIDYGLLRQGPRHSRRLLFLHGTAWSSKQWPEAHWIALARLAADQGYQVQWPWYSAEEQARARRLQQGGGGQLLPRLTLAQLRPRVEQAAGVVGVDTGLAHLAAALGTPAITLYGPTRTELTGALGPAQRNLKGEAPCAPCLERRCRRPDEPRPLCLATLTPEEVWQALKGQMEAAP